MIKCDICGEEFEPCDIYDNEHGEFRCAYCLGFKSPHPALKKDMESELKPNGVNKC